MSVCIANDLKRGSSTDLVTNKGIPEPKASLEKKEVFHIMSHSNAEELDSKNPLRNSERRISLQIPLDKKVSEQIHENTHTESAKIGGNYDQLNQLDYNRQVSNKSLPVDVVQQSPFGYGESYLNNSSSDCIDNEDHKHKDFLINNDSKGKKYHKALLDHLKGPGPLQANLTR